MIEETEYQALLAWKKRALAAEETLVNTCNMITKALDHESLDGVYKAWRHAADFMIKDNNPN